MQLDFYFVESVVCLICLCLFVYFVFVFVFSYTIGQTILLFVLSTFSYSSKLRRSFDVLGMA